MSKESTGKKVALGAVIAAVAGFFAGILSAPKSGKETRDDIKDAAIKAKSEAEKSLKAIHSELNSVLADVKVKGEELGGKAKVEFEEVVVKAKKAKEKVRDVLSGLHDGDADDPDLKKALQDAKDALKSLEKFLKSK